MLFLLKVVSKARVRGNGIYIFGCVSCVTLYAAKTYILAHQSCVFFRGNTVGPPETNGSVIGKETVLVILFARRSIGNRNYVQLSHCLFWA